MKNLAKIPVHVTVILTCVAMTSIVAIPAMVSQNWIPQKLFNVSTIAICWGIWLYVLIIQISLLFGLYNTNSSNK